MTISWPSFFPKCFILCVQMFDACMHVHHVHVWYLRKSEEGSGLLGSGVTGTCEPPCRCWDRAWTLSRAARALNSQVISPVANLAIYLGLQF